MSERWTVFFEPLDVVLFRDHRPFEAGLNVVARSTFPLPTVFLGCLRTALMELSGADFTAHPHFNLDGWAHNLLGNKENSGTISLRGPLLARTNPNGAIEPFFQLPLDLALVDKERQSFEIKAPLNLEKITTSGLLPIRLRWRGDQGNTGGMEESKDLLPWCAKAGKNTSERLLTESGAKRYLAHSPAQGAFVFGKEETLRRSEAYGTEVRVGIARETSLVVREGMFYVTRTFRLEKGFGFAIDVEVPAEDEPRRLFERLQGRVVLLGGKGHRAKMILNQQPLIPTDLENQAEGRVEDQGVKLWLLTPLVTDRDQLSDKIAGQVTGRPVAIGGFDFAQRAPKLLRRAVPAGTVLYFEKDVDVKDAQATLDTNTQDRRTGFGTTLAGRWSAQ